MRRLAIGVFVGCAIVGCALDRAGVGAPGRGDASIDDVDASIEPTDAGGTDLDAVVPQEDANPPVEVDAYVPPVDAPSCTPECEGAVVVDCDGDVPVRTDCAIAGATCGTGPACTGGACSEPTCSTDGTAALRCPDGAPAPPTPCTRGCEGGVCRPPTSCGFDVPRTIRPGETMGVDLCGKGDQHTHDEEDGDCRVAANGEDVTVRLEIARAGTYRVEAFDSDGARIVDPVVYLRRTCGNAADQLECEDDVDGGRDARFDVALDAGDYFLVIDSVNWTDTDPRPSVTYVCGTVRYSVTAL